MLLPRDGAKTLLNAWDLPVHLRMFQIFRNLGRRVLF